ncbi:MAG TPA: hypothetical protein VFX30_00855 [bacterium]|nr:hypothetical protein [bacterium]
MAEIATKVGQSIAEKVITESQKNSPLAGGESDFQKVLTSKLEAQSEMTKQIMNSFGMGGENKIKAVSAEGLEISPTQVSNNQEIRTHGKTMDLLTDVNRGALQMDSLMELTTSGRKFTPPELLAMQAGMHQIALSIDLTGKIVETLNSGTKQLLNTSFQ